VRHLCCLPPNHPQTPWPCRTGRSQTRLLEEEEEDQEVGRKWRRDRRRAALRTCRVERPSPGPGYLQRAAVRSQARPSPGGRAGGRAGAAAPNEKQERTAVVLQLARRGQPARSRPRPRRRRPARPPGRPRRPRRPPGRRCRRPRGRRNRSRPYVERKKRRARTARRSGVSEGECGPAVSPFINARSPAHTRDAAPNPDPQPFCPTSRSSWRVYLSPKSLTSAPSASAWRRNARVRGAS
jgi:hypothetical protein